MRRLFLLRGAPASGKSTWVYENGLAYHTVCADDVRLMFHSPVYDTEGNLSISQNDAQDVWNVVKDAIYKRMSNGDLVILDATNLKTEDMNVYSKASDDYRYRVYVVDFTDVSREVCLERNANREPVRQVPDYVIDNFYNTVANYRIPGSYKKITPDEAISLINDATPYDATQYDAVNFFGDIHGCKTALFDALEQVGCERVTVSEDDDETGFGEHETVLLNDNEMYIFCGDYVDRGIENAECLQFLMDISQKPNTMFLEGNHERWLNEWAHDRESRSKQFQKYTKPELDDSPIDKKEVSRFYRKLIPMAYVQMSDETEVFACHGGIPCIPKPFAGIAAKSLISGVGNYKDSDDVDASWEENEGEPNNIYLVHGHRSSKTGAMNAQPHVFSLEGAIEHGGDIRVVRFVPAREDGGLSIKTYAIANKVFRKVSDEIDLEQCSVADAISNMRANPTIREKSLGGTLSSFNFTREAFAKGAWDSQNIHARGLFVNTEPGDEYIVARSYDKFFAIGERDETSFENVAKSSTFPMEVFKKENGYLGICSVTDEGDLFFASKSTNKGPFAVTFRKLLLSALGSRSKAFAKLLEDEDATAVFEVIDTACDRHIIEYTESKVVLLDIIFNDFKFECMDYDELCDIAKEFRLPVKEHVTTLNNIKEFSNWYDEVTATNYKLDDEYIEGFVLSDADSHMYKTKGIFYRYWKSIRGMIHDVMKRGKSPRVEILRDDHPEVDEFYLWLKEYIADWKEAGNTEDPHVIDVRKAWLEEV